MAPSKICNNNNNNKNNNNDNSNDDDENGIMFQENVCLYRLCPIPAFGELRFWTDILY